MGVIIKGTSISASQEDRGSVYLAVRAATKCIKSTNINKQDIGLLINIGVYRDDNIVEPAMATFIQQQLALNIDPVKDFAIGKSTFCFDLNNGPCGFLYAIQVIDALMKNLKSIKYAIIVSSDVHPSKKQILKFPFSHVGAATILKRSKQNGKGFKDLIYKTSTIRGYTGLIGYVDFFERKTEPRRNIKLLASKDYKDRLYNFTNQTIKEYIDSNKLDTSDMKLVMNQPRRDFAKRIAKSIGIKEESVLDFYNKTGNAHSSALSIGYHIGKYKNLLNNNDKILFVGAGSGLTTTCALYVV
jgi:3-oxoacyl-[acyl-carrier-protein] synthase-3